MSRVPPERRTPADLAIVAVITLVVVVLCGIAWYVSPARTTDSVQAAKAPAAVPQATSVPERLVARWHARSAVTLVPEVADSTIVTGDGGTVVGHDPATGTALWSYRRDADLCAVSTAWRGTLDTVLAVYRNSRGCSEVTALDAKTGRRTGVRTSDADSDLRLVGDTSYVVAQGSTRLETWASNLVRGIEYGRIDAPVNPGVQPGRTGCRLFSSAIATERMAVIEHCGSDAGYRLTVLGTLLDGEEHVVQYGSSIITSGSSGPAPVLVAMNSNVITVYDGGVNSVENSGPSIRLFNSDGAAMTGGGGRVEGSPNPPARSVPVAGRTVVTYWTGKSTVVIDADSGEPMYTVGDAVGPGEVMADRLLLPTRTGISVRDIKTGNPVGEIPLARTDYHGSLISLRVLGSVVVEQRGDIVEAYSAP